MPTFSFGLPWRISKPIYFKNTLQVIVEKFKQKSSDGRDTIMLTTKPRAPNCLANGELNFYLLSSTPRTLAARSAIVNGF